MPFTEGTVVEFDKWITCSVSTTMTINTHTHTKKGKAWGKTNINTQSCHSQLSS